jgi:hypothetical protein
MQTIVKKGGLRISLSILLRKVSTTEFSFVESTTFSWHASLHESKPEIFNECPGELRHHNSAEKKYWWVGHF